MFGLIAFRTGTRRGKIAGVGKERRGLPRSDRVEKAAGASPQRPGKRAYRRYPMRKTSLPRDRRDGGRLGGRSDGSGPDPRRIRRRLGAAWADGGRATGQLGGTLNGSGQVNPDTERPDLAPAERRTHPSAGQRRRPDHARHHATDRPGRRAGAARRPRRCRLGVDTAGSDDGQRLGRGQRGRRAVQRRRLRFAERLTVEQRRDQSGGANAGGSAGVSGSANRDGAGASVNTGASTDAKVGGN
jgi:hypothetical protein